MALITNIRADIGKMNKVQIFNGKKEDILKSVDFNQHLKDERGFFSEIV